jgi:hypothetical protein
MGLLDIRLGAVPRLSANALGRFYIRAVPSVNRVCFLLEHPVSLAALALTDHSFGRDELGKNRTDSSGLY